MSCGKSLDGYGVGACMEGEARGCWRSGTCGRQGKQVKPTNVKIARQAVPGIITPLEEETSFRRWLALTFGKGFVDYRGEKCDSHCRLYLISCMSLVTALYSWERFCPANGAGHHLVHHFTPPLYCSTVCSISSVFHVDETHLNFDVVLNV